jgi:hypothetical protein
MPARLADARTAGRTKCRADPAGRGSLLQDKVAVVTGGARGIGRAIALEMAANGADVVAESGPISVRQQTQAPRCHSSHLRTSRAHDRRWSLATQTSLTREGDPKTRGLVPSNASGAAPCTSARQA